MVFQNNDRSRRSQKTKDEKESTNKGALKGRKASNERLIIRNH